MGATWLWYTVQEYEYSSWRTGTIQVMNQKHFFLVGWVIVVGMIAYGDISKCKQLPWPPRIVAAALVFGLLDLFSALSEELAGIVAIGIVIAAVVNKGFAATCDHAEATAQPASYQSLQTSGDVLA